MSSKGNLLADLLAATDGLLAQVQKAMAEAAYNAE